MKWNFKKSNINKSIFKNMYTVAEVPGVARGKTFRILKKN